jgi:hypothetical protein
MILLGSVVVAGKSCGGVGFKPVEKSRHPRGISRFKYLPIIEPPVADPCLSGRTIISHNLYQMP